LWAEATVIAAQPRPPWWRRAPGGLARNGPVPLLATSAGLLAWATFTQPRAAVLLALDVPSVLLAGLALGLLIQTYATRTDWWLQ
jgi:hypothetical protein